MGKTPVEVDVPIDLADTLRKDEPPQLKKADQARRAPTEVAVELQNAKPVPSEPARPAEARNPQPVADLPDEVEALVKGKIASLRLRLQPADLGPIDLHLVSRKEGLTVQIEAKLPATEALIERYLGELRQTLTDAGLNPAQVTVGFGNHPGQSGDPQHRRASRPQKGQGIPLNDGTDRLGQHPGAPQRIRRGGSRVDYQI